MAIETNELIDVQTLSPFKKFIMTIGNIPTSYLESMSYAELLMWFCNYLQETVIPTVNNNAQAVEELQNLYIELKAYVDDYLTEENLQPMINNKLDQMVEDGTLQTLLNNYAQPVLAELTSEVETATQNVENLTDNVYTILGVLRDKFSKYHKFELPVTMNSWFDQLTIYENMTKTNYKYYINEENLKNSGGSTIYVDCNYTGTSDGTSAQPYKDLQTGFSNTSDGDTIIVRSGIYRREKLPSSNQVINNVNVICDDGVLFTTSSELTWTQNATYTNVYQATRSNATAIIDVRNPLMPIALQQKGSIAECSNTLNSYYTDNSTVYVNIGEEVTNPKIVVSLALGYSPLNISPKNSKNIKFYLENAICLNGNQPIVEAGCSASYDCEFNAKNCKFLYLNNSNTKDGLNLLGCKSVLIGCEASFNGKDGFNYHAQNSKVCYGIELDCVATANGLGRTDDHTFNGSTIHDGSQIIRINGNYNDNNGGNVADVHASTISININCNAFDSTANSDNAYDSDFCAQQAGTTMYLYNCFAKGNSFKNIFAVPDTTIYVSNCNYDSSYGNVIDLND